MDLFGRPHLQLGPVVVVSVVVVVVAVVVAVDVVVDVVVVVVVSKGSVVVSIM